MVFNLFQSKEKKVKELKKQESQIKGQIEQVNVELDAIRKRKSNNEPDLLQNTQTRNMLVDRLNSIQKKLEKL
jgi:predicted  nucleic acid-binding Zn-ribbon protein